MFFLGEGDLCSAMGCSKGCEGDECRGLFFVTFVIVLFCGDVGIETGEFGAGPVDRVNLLLQLFVKVGLPSFRSTC